MMQYVIEKERCLPVSCEVDVLVAGGGTAGAVAAIAAARAGAGVMLVEQFGALGGTATEGMVTPLMNTGVKGNPMCSAISDEINDRMIESGFSAEDRGNNKGHFDPVMLKFILEEMAIEAKVQILYYTYVCDIVKEGDRVKGIVIENKAGRSVILAKRIIDCTGDGDVAYRAGVPFEKGHPDTGKNQPMSVRYIMAGIDLPRFTQFMKEVCEGKNRFHYRFEHPFYHVAVVWDKNWPLEPLFKTALDAGDITYEDGLYWQLFGIPGKNDSFAFNCPEIFEGVDGTNPCDLTNAQIYAKKAILRHVRFYKKYLPGFENSYISEVAAQVGIRESRRIKGVYELTDEDMLLYRKFSDSIGRSNYPVDVHGYNLLNKHVDLENRDSVPYYDIPYRCMLPAGVKGLIVAGRCISATFIAQSSLRVQPTVRAMGEAAGIAAAMSIKKGVDFNELNGEEVRGEMVQRGAKF